MIEAIAAASVVYLDSQTFIYFIEEDPIFGPLVEPVMSALDRGEKRALSSVVTLAEVLVKPFRSNRHDLVLRYREVLLGTPFLRVVAIDERIAAHAARIRARHSFRLPDAVQLAAAEIGGADVFVTNDRGLRGFDDVTVVVLIDHLHVH